jgi:orotidine-5'-phosphate decarboxylase
VNTSNPSANEIQDLRLMSSEPLWKHILKVAMQDWNKHGNIIPVLSATHPENLVGIREIIGQMPIILAGVGVQGGDLDQAIPHCLDDNGFGMMISSSRGIIYSDSPRQAIIDLRDSINTSKQKYYATEGD